MTPLPPAILRFRCDTSPSWRKPAMTALSLLVALLALVVGALVHDWLGFGAAFVVGPAVWFASAPELRWAHVTFTEAGVELVVEPEDAPDHDIPAGTAQRVVWWTWQSAAWPEAPDRRSFPWTEVTAVSHEGWVHEHKNKKSTQGLLRLALESGVPLLTIALDHTTLRESGRVALAANDLRSAALRRALVAVMAEVESEALVT